MEKEFAVPIVSSVKIGGHDFSVVMDNDIRHEMGVMGYTNPEECIIKISSTQVPSQMLNTVIHEVIHALHYDTDLMRELDQSTEEHITTVMANSVCCFIRDNPKFVEMICAMAGQPIRYLNKREANQFYADLLNKAHKSGAIHGRKSTHILKRRA